ncbi:MAB_1171c family putative transporter [Streptomyces sp. NPDC096310]|uniref:MAB_1171c family putative transporter n=1 Tax=Streptomyces sp. NPDC096310 TaxID=3366082 RepID=UPI0037FC4530
MNTSTLVAGALWLVTVWRLPSLRHSHTQRSLALTFAVLAAAMTFEMPAVRDTVDGGTGVPGLSSLLKHLLGVVSAAFLLDFVIAVVRPHGLARRLRLAAIGVTLPLMVVFYALAIWMPGGGAAVDEGRRAVYIVLYTAAFILYIGVAMIVATWLFLGGAQNSRTLPGKAGFGLLGLGTLLGSLYALQRVVFVVVRLATGAGHSELEIQISAALKQMAILLIALGACLPPLAGVVEHIRAWTTLRRLQPLWRHLTGAVPNVVLTTSIPKRRVRFRLDRCVIEIVDACLALREYVPTEVHERARAFATRKGVQGKEVESVAEASWLRVATLSARTANQLAGVEHPSLGVSGSNQTSELAWLVAVAHAYTSSPVVAEFARQEEPVAPLAANHPEGGLSRDN